MRFIYLSLLVVAGYLFSTCNALFEFYGKRTTTLREKNGTDTCLMQIADPFIIQKNFGIEVAINKPSKRFKEEGEEHGDKYSQVTIWLVGTMDGKDDEAMNTLDWTRDCSQKGLEGFLCSNEVKKLNELLIPKVIEPESILSLDSAVVQGLIKNNTYSKTVNSTVGDELVAVTLVIHNCAQALLHFDITTGIFNYVQGRNGTLQKDYISVGERPLPKIYLVFTLLTTGCLITWVWFCLKERQYVHKVHHLMTAFIVVKALTLMSQAYMYHDIRFSGDAEGWNIAYYIFTFCRSSLLFTTLVLIGTGWSLMRDVLSDNVKRLMVALICMQVLTSTAITILEESTPAHAFFSEWKEIFYLLDVLSCCAILFPIVWSINHLRTAAATDGKATRCLIKLRQFRSFYILVVVYIYSTRIIMYLLRDRLPLSSTWIADFLSEAIALGFFVWVGYLFRPVDQNPYVVIENAQEIIEMEGF